MLRVLFAAWTILGFILVTKCTTKPKNFKEGITQLILAGPAFWFFFIIYTPIFLIRRNCSKGKS